MILQLMIREENLTSGDLYLSDFHVNKLHGRQINKLRQHIGYVFQDFRLLQKKTVYDNVAFALEVIGTRKSRINKLVPETLEMVGLSGKAHRMPHELSGGEQQRVAVARAFVNRPLLLLADEPTGNLDPETSDGIMVCSIKLTRRARLLLCLPIMRERSMTCVVVLLNSTWANSCAMTPMVSMAKLNRCNR